MKKSVLIKIITFIIVFSISFVLASFLTDPFYKDTKQIYRSFETIKKTCPIDYEKESLEEISNQLEKMGFQKKIEDNTFLFGTTEELDSYYNYSIKIETKDNRRIVYFSGNITKEDLELLKQAFPELLITYFTSPTKDDVSGLQKYAETYFDAYGGDEKSSFPYEVKIDLWDDDPYYWLHIKKTLGSEYYCEYCFDYDDEYKPFSYFAIQY